MSYIPVIDAARLANDAVTSAKILDGEIVNADISASAAIALSKLATDPLARANHTGTQTASTISDFSSTVDGESVGGDMTGTVGNMAYGLGSIVNEDINAAAAIALSKLATDPLARANHTGTQTASTISDFDTQVQTNSIDELADAAADVGMGGFKITSLGAPSTATDAANKGYVDAIAAGLVDYKASVRLAASGDLDLDGLDTIDGVSLADGDRVLAFGQSTASENGLYTASAGTWARTADADTSAEVTAGMYFSIEEGGVYADSVWLLATDDPITLNTTALSFIQLPSIGDLVAGGGMTKSGNTLDVGAGTGITVNADDVAIDTSVVPRKAVANTFSADQTFSAIMISTGGSRVNVQSKAANYPIVLATDHFLIGNTSGGTVQFTLPASHTAGDNVFIKRNGANAVTVATSDADTIDGSGSDLTLTQDQEAAFLVSDGTNWNRF